MATKGAGKAGGAKKVSLRSRECSVGQCLTRFFQDTKQKKGAKKETSKKNPDLIRNIRPLNRKQAAAMKAQQTKQRALSVAKAIAQASSFQLRVAVQMIAICEKQIGTT